MFLNIIHKTPNIFFYNTQVYGGDLNQWFKKKSRWFKIKSWFKSKWFNNNNNNNNKNNNNNNAFIVRNRKSFLPNWSWARQPLCSARSTLLYPLQLLNGKLGSSNSHLLTSFGMTRPEFEPTTSRLWGSRSTYWANTSVKSANPAPVINQVSLRQLTYWSGTEYRSHIKKLCLNILFFVLWFVVEIIAKVLLKEMKFTVESLFNYR